MLSHIDSYKKDACSIGMLALKERVAKAGNHVMPSACHPSSAQQKLFPPPGSALEPIV